MKGAAILALIGAGLFGVVVGTLAAMRWAQGAAARVEARDTPFAGATVEEHLGRKVPLDLHFVDTSGRRARLGTFMGVLSDEGPLPAEVDPSPFLLVLAYFNCRTLCNLVLQGTARTLAELELRSGVDYRVFTVSIDPRDTPLAAREKEAELGAPEWTFLVGEEAEIKDLAESLGFIYRYDEQTDQFSHPAVIFALTPEGKVSSYLYGLNPEPEEVGAALAEAAVGGTRTTLQRILLRCYHYIPALRRYAGLVKWLLRTGAVLTLLGFGTLVWRLTERVQRREAIS